MSILMESQVRSQLLQSEKLDYLHIEIKLIMAPRGCEITLGAARDDAECGTVDRRALHSLVPP